MNKERLLTELFNCQKLKQSCEALTTRFNYSLYKDLYQDVLLIACEMDEERIILIAKKTPLHIYFSFVARNLYRKKGKVNNNMHNSDWVRRYLSLNYIEGIDSKQEEREENQILKIASEIINIVTPRNQNAWYETEVVKGVIREGNAHKLSLKTAISHRAITKTVAAFGARTKKIIKKNETFMANVNTVVQLSDEAKAIIIEAATKKNIDPVKFIEQTLTEKAQQVR